MYAHSLLILITIILILYNASPASPSETHLSIDRDLASTLRQPKLSTPSPLKAGKEAYALAALFVEACLVRNWDSRDRCGSKGISEWAAPIGRHCYNAAKRSALMSTLPLRDQS